MSNTVDTRLVKSSVIPQSDPSRTRRRQFSRLLWKELLVLRAFTGLLAVVLSLTCGVLWVWRPQISEESSLLLLSLPQLVAIVFAIGSAALLFSQEDESGTLDFLRGMGVSPRNLVNAKLTAGLLCLILLVGGTAAGRWQPPSAPEMSAGAVLITVTSSGAGLVVLLWTSLWSMAIRRELPTVCCGLFGALLLKPFIESWSETGLLLFFGVIASGLWLLCQAAASRWMGSGDWWWTNREATASDDPAGQVRDHREAWSGLLVGTARTVSVTVGSTILVGVVLWLLLMMWWPQSSRAGHWPERLEMVWSMLVSAVLGWLPVRLELRETPPRSRATVRSWRQELAIGPIPWFVVWWLLSLGLMCGYRSGHELALSETLQFFRDAVLPWSILAFSSFRLMARLCSGQWVTWPLSIFPLGAGWCVWWLLAMLGEPAWWGLLMVGALFNGASWWQWQVIRRGQPVWRANLYATGVAIGCLTLFWGLLNWWRVAEVPQDWVGAAKPMLLAAPPDVDARKWAEQRAELAALVAMIQPAPTERVNGHDYPSFNHDWNIIDGRQPWNDVTEATRQWVDSNEAAIAAALRWSPSSRVPDNDIPTDKPGFRTENSQTIDLAIERFRSNSNNLWLLAARRCEQEEQLDEAWRLHRLGFQASRHLMTPEPTQYFWHAVNQYWHYERLAIWVWHSQQTSARLKQAITEVLADGENALPPEVVLPYEFQRFRSSQKIHADTDYKPTGDWSWERWLLRRLCPAESQRERLLIDGLEAAHQTAFADLRPLTRDLSASWNPSASDSSPPVNVVRPTWLIPSPRVPGTGAPGAGVPWVRGFAAELIARTPRLNFPRKTNDTVNAAYGQEWEDAVTQFLSAEGQRRALLLFMAQRAFELDHQRPPKSAEELVPAYLPQHPVTVLSGVDAWTISQRPRNPLWPNNSTDPPALQAFYWRGLVRESPRGIRLEISWTTPPRLVFDLPLPR